MKNKSESTVETKSYRTLGSFERFIWLADHHRPLHFSLVAELNGTAPVTQWINALNALKQQHPLFNVNIHLNENNSPVFTQASGNAPIPFRVVQHTENNSWETELQQELATRFNATQGPLIRVVLYEYADRSVIILSAHHTIADADSLSYVVRDLLNTMDGIFAMPCTMPLAMDDYAGLSMDDLYKLPVNELDIVVIEENSMDERALPQVQTLQLSQELSSHVIQRAQQECTTVHGALSAALVLASKNWKPQPLRIFSSASTRETLGASYSASLNITNRMVTFDLEQHSAFWDIARYSNECLADIASIEYITGSTHQLSGLISSGIDINGLVKFADTALANEYTLPSLGALNYGIDFGNLQLEALWGPFTLTGYEGSQTVGVVTINGNIHLALTTPARTEVKPVLEAVEQILTAECAPINNLA